MHSKDDQPTDETEISKQVECRLEINSLFEKCENIFQKVLRRKTAKDVIYLLGFCALPTDHEIQAKTVSLMTKPRDLVGLLPAYSTPSQNTIELEQLELFKLLWCLVA